MAPASALMNLIFPTRFRGLGACLLFLLALHNSTLAQADSSGCTDGATANEAASQDRPDEGLKAYIDPKTGELVSEPPPGEDSEDGESAQAETAAPEPTVHTLPDGTLMLDLSEMPTEELRAEMVDGKLVLCHRTASRPADPSTSSRNASPADSEDPAEDE